MPELPEVEALRRHIKPEILNCSTQLVVWRYDLRWPIDQKLPEYITRKKCVTEVARRGKYLLLGLVDTATEEPSSDSENVLWLIIHLGMSGTLTFRQQDTSTYEKSLSHIPNQIQKSRKHDHFALLFQSLESVDIIANKTLVFNDPRRFGSLLYQFGNYNLHPRLQNLGYEPLTENETLSLPVAQVKDELTAFDAHNKKELELFLHLKRHSVKKTRPVKTWLMDSNMVIGIGNIYASESLYRARIHPLTQAGKLTLIELQELAHQIRQTLLMALQKGGTSIKDHRLANNTPGAFFDYLSVYGRTGLPCQKCSSPIRSFVLTGRSTYYCPTCQPVRQRKRFRSA